MREFRVEPHHSRLVKLRDERQGVTDGRQQNVTAWLVRFGLKSQPEVVAALADVLATGVDRLGVTVEGGSNVLGSVRFAPLTPAPHHEHGGAQLNAQVDSVESLGKGVATHLRSIGGECTLTEY